MVNVTGDSINFIKKYIIENYDEAFFKRLVSNIEDDYSKEVLSSDISRQGKYDVNIKQELCKVFLDKVGFEKFVRCTEYEVLKQFKGLLGVLARVISLRFLISNIQFLWNEHFSEGKVTAKINADKSVSVDFDIFDCNEAFITHIENYTRKLFEILSKKKFKLQRKKISDSKYQVLYIPIKK